VEQIAFDLHAVMPRPFRLVVEEGGEGCLGACLVG
jgi:hypothetical protein